MRKFFRLFFNYYLVLKACWFVGLFLLLGFLGLGYFDQGQDVLKTLTIAGKMNELRYAFFAYVAVSWWAWQSFRAARITLHFSYFNFWTYNPSYAFRAQVLVPRIIATLPYLLFAYALYKAQGKFTAYGAIVVSSALWMYVFIHFRKDIIVWLHSLRPIMPRLIPHYIPIKNGTYPANFIWAKQRNWFVFRLTVSVFIFLMVFMFPVQFPQLIGSTAVVLFGFGSWLILASIVAFIEKMLRFPVSFTLLFMVVGFSFLNNNHHIEHTSLVVQARPSLTNHFENWLAQRQVDSGTTVVHLVMIEGGGLRSAYWSSSILNKIQQIDPNFKDHVYAYSTVSGGSLGALNFESHNELGAQDRLKVDLLSPITAAFIYTDMLQKFIPFPIGKLDRARVLNASIADVSDGDNWEKGFLETFSDKGHPLLLLNTTHVESGRRVIISNANIGSNEHRFDFFELTQKDISVSSAIGLSSRFPVITPPATIKSQGKTWGNLVDGGYYENLGVQSMLDVYAVIQEVVKTQHKNVRFNLIAIRNTKPNDYEHFINGLPDVQAPIITFSNIWANNSDEVLMNSKSLIEANGDNIHVVKMERNDKETIPLGWYLSQSAIQHIDRQVQRYDIEPLLQK